MVFYEEEGKLVKVCPMPMAEPWEGFPAQLEHTGICATVAKAYVFFDESITEFCSGDAVTLKKEKKGWRVEARTKGGIDPFYVGDWSEEGKDNLLECLDVATADVNIAVCENAGLFRLLPSTTSLELTITSSVLEQLP